MSDKFLKELENEVMKLSTRKSAKDFLKMMLTLKEVKEISKRLQIFKMLEQGIPQRKIAATLKVGIATVTRGSREMNWRNNTS